MDINRLKELAGVPESEVEAPKKRRIIEAGANVPRAKVIEAYSHVIQSIDILKKMNETEHEANHWVNEIIGALEGVKDDLIDFSIDHAEDQ